MGQVQFAPRSHHSASLRSAWLPILLAACCLLGLGACGRRAAVPAPAPATPAAAPPVINVAPAAAPVVNILPPPPPPAVKPITIVLSASGSVNPGFTERPSPVTVRVYELKSSATFEAADFFALQEKEREILGADLLGRDEFQLQPAERIQFSRKLSADTRRVAAMVAFRDLERSVWKASLRIGDPPPGEIRILIDARRVQVLAQ